MSTRFTYGDQFEESKTPLHNLLNKIFAGYTAVADLQADIQRSFFEDGKRNADNARKMAMNCRLSLKAYELIKVEGDDYTPSEIARNLKNLFDSGKRDEAFALFASHILLNLSGLPMLRMIENIRTRGEQVTLEYISEELNESGLKVPSNSTYVSTMRAWLEQAGIFRAGQYDINWDVVYSNINTDNEQIEVLYNLSREQRYYVLALAHLADPGEWIASNKVAGYVRDVYKIRLTSKNLVKDILEPIEAAGIIETQKTTTGRGAKPHDVRLTASAESNVLKPILKGIADLTNLEASELNRTFESVVADLDDPDKHVAGKALELLAVWMVRLLSLRFSKWRLRSYQATGGGEVDVMAASDKIVYSRWQIQCKNHQSRGGRAGTAVGTEVIAKEVGLTFLTRADVVMIVTTSSFSRDAVNYANLVNENSRYYVILLDGEDIARIREDKTTIIDILNVKARRVFARRELNAVEEEEEGSSAAEGIEVEAEMDTEAETAAAQLATQVTEGDS